MPADDRVGFRRSGVAGIGYRRRTIVESRYGGRANAKERVCKEWSLGMETHRLGLYVVPVCRFRMCRAAAGNRQIAFGKTPGSCGLGFHGPNRPRGV